jgi:uncharacterized protein RhaS with RHS repeats
LICLSQYPRGINFVKALGFEGGLNTYAYLGGNPVSNIDPMGLADINLFGQSDKFLWNAANNVPSGQQSIFTVAGHGTPISVNPPNGAISPKDLATLIRSNPNYSRSKTIHLYACNVGGKTDDNRPSFAQELANILGQNVYAPTQYAWYDQSGFVGSYGRSQFMFWPWQTGGPNTMQTFGPKR